MEMGLDSNKWYHLLGICFVPGIVASPFDASPLWVLLSKGIPLKLLNQQPYENVGIVLFFFATYFLKELIHFPIKVDIHYYTTVTSVQHSD